MSAAGSASQGQKRKNFNVLEREEVIRYLLATSKDGARRHGSFQEAAVKYGCSWKTIKGVWVKHEKREAAGDPSAYIRNDRKGKSGRKGIDIEELRTRLRDVPLNERTTHRRLAAALGIPQQTLFDNLKALGLRAHSNALKPYLTPDGKKERLRWVLRWLSTARAGRVAVTRVLHDFEDFVHVDEKWFYLFKDGQKFYLYDGEEPPIRKVQSKRFITRSCSLLLLLARDGTTPPTASSMARSACGPSQRRCGRHAAAETVLLGLWSPSKCVEVTKETFKEKLINGVIPAIKEKWPAATRENTIFCQQDNAKPHRVNDDEGLREACSSNGFDIELINQPPNSPDTNILDLGFFASIQSLQDRTRARTIDNLLREVEIAWAATDPRWARCGPRSRLAWNRPCFATGTTPTSCPT
ncbi:unnamed protein product [Pylaiella littoralis]